MSFEELVAAKPNCIKGTDGAEEIKADLHGSNIFGSGSKESEEPDYVTCGAGTDTLFFSACHLKDGKYGLDTAVVGFDTENDTIVFFCSLQRLDDLHITREETESGTVLILTSDRVDHARVAILGANDPNAIKVEFNKKFETVCAGAAVSDDHHHHGPGCHHHDQDHE